MLLDKTVRELLAAFSSPEPTPGGGSASALSAALGASLLMMVGSLTKTRTGSGKDRSALASATGTLADIRRQMADAVDADTAAYDRVVTAYKMPKAETDQQHARQAAIDSALRAATDVPLDVVRLSAAALAEAESIARHGHRAAGSDVGVGIALLRAGLEGARLNVETNLTGIRDEVYVARIRRELERLIERARVSAHAAEGLLAHG